MKLGSLLLAVVLIVFDANALFLSRDAQRLSNIVKRVPSCVYPSEDQANAQLHQQRTGEVETRLQYLMYVQKAFRDGECRLVVLQKAAECIAEVAAGAYSQAKNAVFSDGKRAYACGFSRSEAEAVDCSVAKAIVDISVELNGRHVEAECDAYVGGVVEALAGAAPDANFKICATGNGMLKSDFKFEAASAIQTVVVDAWAGCIAFCSRFGAYSAAAGAVNAETFDSIFQSVGAEAYVGTDK